MGSMRSIIRIFCLFGSVLAMKYAAGYPIIRQMTVAMTASLTDRQSIVIYFGVKNAFMLSSVKAKSRSVKA